MQSEAGARHRSRTERRLRDEGYSDVYSLQEHPRWGSGAQTVIRWIEERDWASLLSRKASDLGLLGLCDPEHTVFLDIETTGLSASAPLFMVGMLLPASSGLRLCQIFARDYDEEPAVLEEAVARLSSAHAVVTYNGRCFDVPFIHRRLAYHGRDEAFTGLVVDLLTHTRRAYRSYLPNCRLATVQTSILGTPARTSPASSSLSYINSCTCRRHPACHRPRRAILAMADQHLGSRGGVKAPRK